MKILARRLAAAAACCLAFAPGIAAADDTLGMALMSALVNGDGTVASGSAGVTGVTHAAGSGEYDVTFDRDVTACVSAATSPAPVLHALPAGSLSANAVHIVTSSLLPNFSGFTLTPLDADFNLMVFCPE